MIDNALLLLKQGLVEAPLHFDFVMGSRGSQPATARQLVFLSESIPREATWTVAALGRHQLPMAMQAIAMGGHARVGLEDNIYYRYGKLASNEALRATFKERGHGWGLGLFFGWNVQDNVVKS